jgi:hypothetical protein
MYYTPNTRMPAVALAPSVRAASVLQMSTWQKKKHQVQSPATAVPPPEIRPNNLTASFPVTPLTAKRWPVRRFFG